MIKTNQSELLGKYPRFVACVVNDKQLVASAAVVLLQYYTGVWSCDYPQSIAAVSRSIAAAATEAAAEVIVLAAVEVRAAVLSPHYTDDLVLENN